MDIKRHLKSALKQLGFDKPRKAQIIPMNTLDAEQDAIIMLLLVPANRSSMKRLALLIPIS